MSLVVDGQIERVAVAFGMPLADQVRRGRRFVRLGWFRLRFDVRLGGWRLGLRNRRQDAREKEAPIGAVVGAALGLLAFLLAHLAYTALFRHDLKTGATEILAYVGNAVMLCQPHCAALDRRAASAYTFFYYPCSIAGICALHTREP